jgi:asparagine synthase (glutamine-hydrolysing)
VQWFSYLDRTALTDLFPGLGWDDDDWAGAFASQRAALENAGPGSGLYRMQATDLVTWLPGNMLERGDRMTMAEGLELRPPFLDKELAVFGLALPDRLKVRGGAGKWIVRQWAKARIPDEILRRPKWGFRTPLTEWFRGPLREMLHDYLSDPSGIVGAYGDRQRIAELVAAHQSGGADNADALWTLLSAAVWYRDVYLPRRSDPARAVAEAAYQ